MDIIGLDAETYYDKDFSLSKMMTQEYIEDPRFEELMWAAARVGGTNCAWQVGRADTLLDSINWSDTTIVAHNAQFDGSILSHHHDIHPAHVICTMGMARALGIHKITGSVSLATLADFFGAGTKGSEVVNAIGMRRSDFSPQQMAAYREYNKLDVTLTNSIFSIMREHLKDEELLWNSMVNKMFTCPTLSLDEPRLQEELVNIKRRRKEQQQRLVDHLGFSNIEAVKKALGSSIKFAALLESAGVEVPMKKSPTTGKDTFAFAKTDQGFIQLLDSPNETVKMLAETRLGVKSNTEQTRIERLITLSNLPSDKFRIPHKISGAHTHRLSGTDSINIQNFSSGRIAGQTKTARQSILMHGGKLAAPDSGQIEARILSFIANDTEMLDIFSSGRCPYAQMAGDIFGRSPADIYKGAKEYSKDKPETFDDYIKRQTGKGSVLSLGFGTGAGGLLRALRDVYRVTDITEADCIGIHSVYRQKRTKVVDIWDTCNDVIDTMIDGGSGYFGGADDKLFYFTSDYDLFGTAVPGILLPNGTWLTYPGLHRREGRDLDGEPTGYTDVAYFKDMRKFHRAVNAYMKKHPEASRHAAETTVGYKHGSRVWFGTIIENLCQALAFAVLKWQGVRIQQVMPVAFNVHDEFIIGAVDDDIADKAAHAQTLMQTSPPWLKGLKFECEYDIADTYGDC